MNNFEQGKLCSYYSMATAVMGHWKQESSLDSQISLEAKQIMATIADEVTELAASSGDHLLRVLVDSFTERLGRRSEGEQRLRDLYDKFVRQLGSLVPSTLQLDLALA